MMSHLNEKDLRRFPQRGYKIALILPQLNEEKLRSCITYYRSIYNSLSSRGSQPFDPINQVITGIVGREEYTFLLVRDYNEQDELLTYFPEYAASLDRLGDNGKLDMLKVMPDGSITDANLIPLCNIRKLSEFDKIKLQAVIHNRMDGVENFDFTLVDNHGTGTTKVYYKKARVKCSLKKESRDSYREYRFARVMRMFYNESYTAFGENFFLNNNVEFLDELNCPTTQIKLYSMDRREKEQKIEKQYSPKGLFVSADFDQIECPKGYKVLAIKQATKDCDYNYIPKVISRSFNKTKAFDVSVKVQSTFVNSQEVIAIYCKENAYDAMNNRVSIIYAHLAKSRYYKNDSTMFYYRDVNNQVMPISHVHLCQADVCGIPSEQKLQSVLESKIGNGYNIDIKYNKNGNYDCYAKVNECAAARAQSINTLDWNKSAAIRAAQSTFGSDLVVYQENDGSIKGATKSAEMQR